MGDGDYAAHLVDQLNGPPEAPEPRKGFGGVRRTEEVGEEMAAQHRRDLRGEHGSEPTTGMARHPFQGLQGSIHGVVVGYGHEVKIGMLLDVGHDLGDGGHAVADAAVDVEIGFAQETAPPKGRDGF